MNKSKPNLSPEEVAVCQRLREVRLSLKLGQPDFAKELSIPFPRLAAYEYARAPVRFGLGFSLCERFRLSLRWLATGRLPQRPFTPISHVLLGEIDERDTFLSAYKSRLSTIVEARFKELNVKPHDDRKLIWDFRRLGVSQAESHLENVAGLVQSVAKELDEQKKLQFAFALERLAFSHSPSAKAAVQKMQLPYPATSGKVTGDMKPLWPDRKREIQKAVAKPGAKSALAKFLGVKPAQLSKWLTDSKSAREPGAEYLLRMLYWVEHPELHHT